jgi:hypothetical protein
MVLPTLSASSVAPLNNTATNHASLPFCPRYHSREQQFRLCTLLKCCEDKKEAWLEEYVACMLQHEAKVLPAVADNCLIRKLLSPRSDLCVKLIPEVLKRAPSGDELIVNRSVRGDVADAIRMIIDYDGRLSQSPAWREMNGSGTTTSSARCKDSMAVCSAADDGIGAAVDVEAAPSSSILTRLSIRDDISSQYA